MFLLLKCAKGVRKATRTAMVSIFIHPRVEDISVANVPPDGTTVGRNGGEPVFGATSDEHRPEVVSPAALSKSEGTGSPYSVENDYFSI